MQSDRGAIGNLLVVVLGGAAGAGLLVGAVLGLTGAASLVSEPSTLADAAVASYYDCPDGEALGTVTRGDRVFITGRDASGDWAEIRSPDAPNSRVWMRARQVLPDGETDDLPVFSCNVPVEEIAVAVTTIPEEASTTTVGESTTTTSSTTSTTTTTTTVAATTTTTLPPPSVNNISENPDPIWEQYSVGGYSCSQPPTSTIAASVSAAAGVQSVTMSWTSAHGNGSQPMSNSGGTYNATLGPFEAAGSENGAPDTVSITVSVIDNQGRQATGQATVTLNDCTFS